MKYLFVSVISVFLFVGTVFAQEFPAYDGAVTDLAGVLSAQEESLLETQIQQLRDSTTVEAAVLFIPTTGEYEIADYTIGLGNHWGVGKSDIDNGIVMVIAVDDRKWFTATGYGVEGALPDILVDRISEKHLPTAFRANDYFQGVYLVFTEFSKILSGDLTTRSQYKNQDFVLGWKIYLHIFVVFAFFIISLQKKKGQSGSFLATLFIIIHFTLLGAATLFSAGIIMYALLTLIYSTFVFSTGISSGGGSSGSWGSGGGWSSGGGGFSGFSGGSFGGGGSGGSW